MSYEALQIEIDHIKEDIKEIKLDSKETNKYFRDTIEILKENSIKQTEILRNQERQFTELNTDMSSLNDDINGLRTDMNNRIETQTKWYQDFLSSNFGIVIKILVAAILLLSGIKIAGIDLMELLK